jgi:hypothetical protein
MAAMDELQSVALHAARVYERERTATRVFSPSVVAPPGFLTRSRSYASPAKEDTAV